MALKQVIPVIKTFFLGTNTQLKKTIHGSKFYCDTFNPAFL